MEPVQRLGRVVAIDRKTTSCEMAILSQGRLVTMLCPTSLVNTIAEGDLVSCQFDSAGNPTNVSRLGAAPGGTFSGRGDALRWQQRDGGAPSRMAFLDLRHTVLRTLRLELDSMGFLEMETPTLARAPSPEAVFEPIPAGSGDYLITSPEFQLKRMLVGGFERIYRLGPVFRGGEVGDAHNPEFTLLEWYRTLAGTEDLAGDLARFLRALAPVAEQAAERWSALPGLAKAVPRHLEQLAKACRQPAIPQVTVREICRETLGLDVRGITEAGGLRSALRRAGLTEEAREDWDFTALFSALWLRVEARLPVAPLLVTEWPAPLASLARLKPEDPTVAERVELYAGGLELANGFAELTDPAEQRRRFLGDLEHRRLAGMPPVPLDEAFLAALQEGMPPAAGMALGVDRLVMLLTGATRLRQVLPFAWDER